MGRARDPNRDKAFEIWQSSGGQINLIEIAEQLGLSAGTVRGWKAKDEWDAKLNGTFQTKQRSAPKQTELSRVPREPTKQIPATEIQSDELPDKYRIFVMEYLRDFNATRAAMACGYKKSIAHTEGWRLLKKQEVRDEIKRLNEMLAGDLMLDVKRVIAEYMKIAFVDITDVVNFGKEDAPIVTKEGAPVLNEDGSRATTAVSYVALKNDYEIDGSVISEVKQGKDGVSVKLHDKMRALQALEKYLGYMTEEERLKLDKLRAEVKALEDKGGDIDTGNIDQLTAVMAESVAAIKGGA